jgi:pimeloyl-ACP methyl ester carboxylesterase
VPEATVNGIRLYYEERGSGAPILGLHGAGSSALLWEDAAERLAELGRVVTYDRRGCSRSERPSPYEVTSVREHADDALALLRGLDAGPAVLVGRSYGGTVALDLALREPGSVLGIALLEAGLEGLTAEYDAWFDSLRATAEAVAAEQQVSTVGEAAMREVFGTWEGLPEAMREVFTENSPALLAELRGGERTDSSLLQELRVPALVVTADDSPPVIRNASDALAAALPGARHARVSGGHAIDPAGSHVLEFVSELLADRP